MANNSTAKFVGCLGVSTAVSIVVSLICMFIGTAALLCGSGAGALFVLAGVGIWFIMFVTFFLVAN